MVVSNPTLLVPNSSPLSVSYIYLLNTERSSSGVRTNDHAHSNIVLQSLDIGLSRHGREVFRSAWAEGQKRDEFCYFSELQPQSDSDKSESQCY